MNDYHSPFYGPDEHEEFKKAVEKQQKETEPGPIAKAIAVILFASLIIFGILMIGTVLHDLSTGKGGSHTHNCTSYDECEWRIDNDASYDRWQNAGRNY